MESINQNHGEFNTSILHLTSQENQLPQSISSLGYSKLSDRGRYDMGLTRVPIY